MKPSVIAVGIAPEQPLEGVRIARALQRILPDVRFKLSPMSGKHSIAALLNKHETFDSTDGSWMDGSEILLIPKLTSRLEPMVQQALKREILILAPTSEESRRMLGLAGLFFTPENGVAKIAEVVATIFPSLKYALEESSLRHLRPTKQYTPHSSITVASPFMVYDGYGSMAEYLTLGMQRAGATVNIAPIFLDLAGMSDEFRALAERTHLDADAPVLYHCWPDLNLAQYDDTENLVFYTMWESSWLPKGWVQRLNKARAVLVPTRFVANVFRECGVERPIEVIPQGCDPDLYSYQDRVKRPSLTTLIVGTMIERKNTREAISAWKQAFSKDAEARLIIKARFQYGNYIPDDPRIRFVDTNESSRGILHWYQQADVLLALGSEGFGLPLIEGMATGLPVIALNAEGQADVCSENAPGVLPIEPVGWRTCYEQQFGGHCGVRAIPDVQEVITKLQWVANHRDEARIVGKQASEWVRKHRNVWTLGPAVLEAMERHVQPSRPLRRVPTLWTPSWRDACGISEYTDYLASHIPYVKVAKEEPNPNGSSVVHIQHENALFDDVKLTEYITNAGKYGVPVVVTEHTVDHEVRAWEQKASVLISMTRSGTQILRGKLPAKRIEYVPHGCPTWFPKRKLSRGRVIAAFGFLEWYKGFSHLLQILRDVPDTELLLYSRAKSAEIEERWEEAIQGLPVRWVREYLPIEEVAARLAAEADILTFWYEEVARPAASGATRVALATGVPVLTSRTAWFEDLGDVTFQPDTLEGGVRRLLDDTHLRDSLVAAAREYCHQNSWQRNAQLHTRIWATL